MMVSEDFGYSQYLEYYLECFLCKLVYTTTCYMKVSQVCAINVYTPWFYSQDQQNYVGF